MSETPATPVTEKPVTENTTPFVTTTTPAIERANRLLALRAHPGFLELVRLSQNLVQEAVDATSDYPGWDPQQIVVLKVRQQTAKEYHKLLFQKMSDAIAEGIAEARLRTASLPETTVEEAMERGDYVRAKVLERFDEQDQRAAGSY